MDDKPDAPAECSMAALSMPASGDAAQPSANSAVSGNSAEALQRVAAALDPAQPQLARSLATLRATLEANQVRQDRSNCCTSTSMQLQSCASCRAAGLQHAASCL